MNTYHLHHLAHVTFKGVLLAGLAAGHLLQIASAADTPQAGDPQASDPVYLTPEMATEVENFQKIRTNLNFEGNTISIGHQEFEHGLGVHAPSRIVFTLEGNYKTFHVVPGPDDANAGLLEMKILVDDTEVWSSGKVKSPKFVAEPLELPVAGAQTLTLIVDDCGERGGDHASWGDAYLVPAAKP